jgi:hypothetical protein
MNNLRRLVVSLNLMSVLVVTAFAGETQTPPCAPGEIQSPPCSSAPVTSVDPGQTDTPPAADSFSFASFAEEALFDLLIF